MLDNVFEMEDVREHFRKISTFLCNSCNSVTLTNNNKDIDELPSHQAVTRTESEFVTTVTVHDDTEVQLSFTEMHQEEESQRPAPQKCYWCGSTDFWQGDGRTICRRCHPPAPGAEKVAFSGKTRGY